MIGYDCNIEGKVIVFGNVEIGCGCVLKGNSSEISRKFESQVLQK